jgi:monoamine oxidase
MNMRDFDVVVVGAGAAGLGAATALKQAGRRAVVLEASGRVGGRAWTAYPPELGGVWFDMGAIWLHDAEHNPLVPIAEARGERLLRADELRTERTFIAGRPMTPQEEQEYDKARERFEKAAESLLADGGDVPFSAVSQSLADDPWALTIEGFQGAVIDAAPVDHLSLRDWHDNALNGNNLIPESGLGAFIARLREGLDIRLDTPVRRVRWGGDVAVETDGGVVTAGSCIVTASTGVLAAGGIVFDPPLPADVQETLDAVPMGLAIKVVLRATGPDRLDLPRHCSLFYRVERRGDPLMPFQCWPYGRDYVQGWIGGAQSWELAREGDSAVVDFALAQLRKMFGGRADRVFAGGAKLVTHWDADPWIRGAYAYARPGWSEARRRLGQPLAGGRLLLAGEACNRPYAGTLAGAWLSGQQAAGMAG